MAYFLFTCYVVLMVAVAYTNTQYVPFPYEASKPSGPAGYLQPSLVPDCPLESHPDTPTMFIMRGPLGDPEPRSCPPKTYYLRSVCSCVNQPTIEKCNLRPSSMGASWYEENVFGMWIQRPCGPGSAFNSATCDCSLNL